MVARSPVFDLTIPFLAQGPVDNFTQNWTGERLVFLSGIHLLMSMCINYTYVLTYHVVQRVNTASV